MKLSSSAALLSALFMFVSPITSASASPDLYNAFLPEVTTLTTTRATSSSLTPSTFNLPPTITIADVMSDATATASIDIIGHSSKNSGADIAFIHSTAVLPMALISALFLI